MSINTTIRIILGGLLLIILLGGTFYWLRTHDLFPGRVMQDPVPGTEDLGSFSTSVQAVLDGISEFLLENQDAEGKFRTGQRCEGQKCQAVAATENTVFGYAILGLAVNTDNPEAQAGADRAMERLLRLCDQNEQACLNNFFAFAQYADRPEALSAMKKAGALLLRNDNATERVVPLAVFYSFRKAAILYELTADVRYKTWIQQAADRTLNRWDELDDQLYRTQSGVLVTYLRLYFVNELLLPAYQVTGDIKYLDRALATLEGSEIDRYVTGLRTADGITLLLGVTEAMLSLSEEDALSEAKRTEFREGAARLVREIIAWNYDLPERPFGDGTGGLMTGANPAVDTDDVNYKNTNSNGWFAAIIDHPALADMTFDLPRLVSAIPSAN